jgi:quinolinate synthase
MTEAEVLAVKARFPEAKFLVHPECPPEVCRHADYAGSTAGIIAYARKSDKPGEGERLELKREFALACAGFEIPKSEVNELSKNLGEIVDQLGGKYGRKLIDVLIENGVKVS